MGKYRKKPVVIEAVQFTGTPSNYDEMEEFMKGGAVSVWADRLLIETLEGEMRADLGDWIIKGVAGEFYPCKPDIFETTYERVPDKETPNE